MQAFGNKCESILSDAWFAFLLSFEEIEFSIDSFHVAFVREMENESYHETWTIGPPIFQQNLPKLLHHFLLA